MNRTLRRPMFRIGGTAEGITSGLQPRKGYAGTENTSDQRVSKWPTGRNFNDFLISFGLDLATRPKAGNIFQQAAASAKTPFEQFQARRAAQEDKDWRRKWEQEGRDIKAKQHSEEMAQATKFHEAEMTHEGKKLGFEKEKFGTEIDLTRDFNEAEIDIKNRELNLQETLSQEEIRIKEEGMGIEEDKLSYAEKRDNADRALQKYLGELEAKGKNQFLEEKIDEYWDAKISAAPSEERERLEQLKAEEKHKIIIKGFDVSDKYAILKNSQAFEEASDLARLEIQATINPSTTQPWDRNDPGYSAKVIELTNKFLKQISEFLEEEKKATGGRVGYQNAGPVMPGQPMQARAPGPTDQGETNQVNISYEQLRDRLPPEISNEIVLLLSQSYEAFADFAEIQTQADVNEFNTKYNVQLVLPKQAGA